MSSPTPTPTTVSIKVRFGEELRRTTVSLPSLTVSDVCAALSGLFPTLTGHSLRITYLDEDNEWIAIGSDAEVIEAVRTSSPLLRLRIEDAGVAPTPSAPAPAPAAPAQAAIDLAVARAALASEGLDGVVGDMRLAKVWLRTGDIPKLVTAVRRIKSNKAAKATATATAAAPTPLTPADVMGVPETKSDDPTTPPPTPAVDIDAVKADLVGDELDKVVGDGRLRGLVARFKGDMDAVKQALVAIQIKRAVDVTPALTALAAAGLEGTIGDARLRSIWVKHDGDIDLIVDTVRAIADKKKKPKTHAEALEPVKAALAAAGLSDVVKPGRLRNIYRKQGGDIAKTVAAVTAMHDASSVLPALEAAGIPTDTVPPARIARITARFLGDVTAVVKRIGEIAAKKAERAAKKAGPKLNPAERAARLAQTYAEQLAAFDATSPEMAAFRPRNRVLNLMDKFTGDVDVVVQKVTALMARH